MHVHVYVIILLNDDHATQLNEDNKILSHAWYQNLTSSS